MKLLLLLLTIFVYESIAQSNGYFKSQNNPYLKKQSSTRFPSSNKNTEPNVKKSRSGICHWKASSQYYSMTKYYQSFPDIQSCLNSGGRCPKKDSKCQSVATTNNRENSHKQENQISSIKKLHIEPQNLSYSITETEQNEVCEKAVKQAKIERNTAEADLRNAKANLRKTTEETSKTYKYLRRADARLKKALEDNNSSFRS